MTPEQFAEIIVQGDLDKIAAAVASLDERQRSKLSRITVRIHEEFVSGNYGASYVPPSKPTLFALRERLHDQFRPSNSACKLALMAVASSSKAKIALQFWARHFDQLSQEVFLRVVTDRRPVWIDRWIEAELSSTMFHSNAWAALWPLIRAGVCQKPTSAGYMRWMVHALPYYKWDWEKRKGPLPLSELLLQDFELLEEDVWKLFEVETRALTSDNWPSALVELSQQGRLDRDRLLDASLKALSNGFMNDVLTGYYRFFERMRPTVDEVACRQPVLSGLLANPASHVVGFALKKLGELARAVRLDGEAFLGAMPSVFQTRSKGQPMAALRIAEQIVKHSPNLLPHAVASLLEALAHPAADVQKKAIVLLESWAARLHSDHATAIRERIEELAPSVRARAEAVADKLASPPAQESNISIPIDDFAAELAELAAAADELPPRWRELAGVNEAIAAIGSGNIPAPLAFDLMAVPVLTGVRRIAPIGSLEELIDAVAHAVESIDSADEVERILDGLSRLGHERPADFERRTAPLVKRIRESGLAESTRGFTTLGPARDTVYQLLLLWITGELHPPRLERYAAPATEQFYEGRLRELIAGIMNRTVAPLLAAPTHEGGWIDSAALLERLMSRATSGTVAGQFDFIQALLRLAPDNRAETLSKASDLPSDCGRILRWALGGAQRHYAAYHHNAAVWLAAARARRPKGDHAELAAVGIGEDVPDGVRHAEFDWRSIRVLREGLLAGLEREYRLVDVVEQPLLEPKHVNPLWPTVSLHARDTWHRYPHSMTFQDASGATVVREWVMRSGFLSVLEIDALATIWPLCLDSFFTQAVCEMAARIDKPASAFEPNHVYIKPLLEPDRPWTEMAVLAVWMALASKDTDARTAALDVLVESVSDGRAMPDQMGDVLSKLQRGRWLKLHRVADALGEIARLSPLHAWFGCRDDSWISFPAGGDAARCAFRTLTAA